MFTFDATEQINEVSRTTRTTRRTTTTTTQVITRYFGRWPQTKTQKRRERSPFIGSPQCRQFIKVATTQILNRT